MMTPVREAAAPPNADNRLFNGRDGSSRIGIPKRAEMDTLIILLNKPNIQGLVANSRRRGGIGAAMASRNAKPRRKGQPILKRAGQGPFFLFMKETFALYCPL
jgi:hypothetical protein